MLMNPFRKKNNYNNFCFLRPRRLVADAELACEQAHCYLTIKAQNRWGDLAMVRPE